MMAAMSWQSRRPLNLVLVAELRGPSMFGLSPRNNCGKVKYAYIYIYISDTYSPTGKKSLPKDREELEKFRGLHTGDFFGQGNSL